MSQGNCSEQDSDACVDFVRNGDSYQDETSMPLDHTPFMVTVKHEPEIDLGMDGTNTPPPTAPTSPSPPPMPRDSSSEDRTNLTLGALLPPITSSTPQPMPTALRVAAFATDVQSHLSSTPTHGVLKIERPTVPLNRSAPNLGAVAKGNRTMPLHSTSSINFVHPPSKLMLPRKQLPPMRIPREISVQPANTRALKAVPIRDTGYSLRPDRMIPDLEQSISPPQSPSPPMSVLPVPKGHLPPYASTSRQAQMLSEQHLPNRKRRLNFAAQQIPVPVKIQRSSTLQFDDVLPPVEDHRSKQIHAEEKQRRKQQQEELFKTELTQLATAMRQAQKEMLESFFQQQKQLARREHEFQLRQDNLVMSALRKQTDALLRTAKELMHSGEAEEEEQIKEEAEQGQRETKTNEGDILLVEPEIELSETSLPKHECEDPEEVGDEDENGDDDDDEAANNTELAVYENDVQQDSEDDAGNHSESLMEMSMSVHSDDASNQGSIPPHDDSQLS